MKTKFASIFGGLLVLCIMIFSFTSCVNPSEFNPYVSDDTFKVDVTGTLDVRFLNSAVLWVINTTKSVDVKKITVNRTLEPEEDSTKNPEVKYPKTYFERPKSGSRYASYHKPTTQEFTVDIEYVPVESPPVIPGIEISAGTKSLELQMPHAKDYVLFLYRNGEGEIAFEYLDTPPVNHQNDAADPQPPMPNERDDSTALLIHNKSKTATITGIDFSKVPNGSTESWVDEIPAGKENAAFLKSGNYIATVNFNVGIVSDNSIMASVTVPDSTIANAYFYLGKDGKYYLIQQWLPSSSSVQPDLSDNITGTALRVINNANLIQVYRVKISFESSRPSIDSDFEMTVDNEDFEPTGVISFGDAKIAILDEDIFKASGLSFGENMAYTVTVYMNRYSAVNKNWDSNSYHLEFTGKNFFRDTIVEIEVTNNAVDRLIRDWDMRPDVNDPDDDPNDAANPNNPINDPNPDPIGPGGPPYNENIVHPGGPGYRTFSVGQRIHTLAIKGDGRLYAWGEGLYGKLGNNTTSGNKNTPTSGSSEMQEKVWKVVWGGYNFTMAIRTDGTLWGWGYGGNGQFPGKGTANQPVPVQIGTEKTWVDVAGGHKHVLAVKSDGTLWSWGNGSCGELGQGNTNNYNTPTRIGTGSNWAKVAAGYNYSMALDKDGKLYAWGENSYGKLGNGNTSTQKSPVQIGGSLRFKDMAVGQYHSAAITTTGELYTWGYNCGRLGNGDTKMSSVPVLIPVPGGGQWVSVAVGYYHTVAVKNDGTLWAWGEHNGHGQIGDGSTTRRLSPVQIAPNTFGWVGVAASYHHSVALRTDGSLWAWGWNVDGQLGDGTNKNRTTPVKVIP